MKQKEFFYFMYNLEQIYCGYLKREGLDGIVKNHQDNSTFSSENQEIPGFTLEDIKILINKMERKIVIKPRKFLINVPFIDRSLYEKSWFGQKKIDILKEQLKKAENGTEADRRRFIDELELATESSKLKSKISKLTRKK